MKAIRYTPAWEEKWDALVDRSVNGTFLFKRSFMDYHKDRFEDSSLVLLHKGNAVGVLPANIKEKTVFSHAGLTYGGLVWDKKASSLDIREMLECSFDFFKKELGANKLVYRPVPYIYHKMPAESDLYFLFAHKALLTDRSLSSTIPMNNLVGYSMLRRRHLRMAEREGLRVNWDESAEKWQKYWMILSDVLRTRHKVRPVHSLEEIRLLKSRFSKEIRLVTVEKEGETVGGTVLFVTDNVVHSQYIASNEAGCRLGALEKLFNEIFNSDFCKEKRYFDFGNCMDDMILNEGLLFQKEGLGGRGTCYDEYSLEL